MFQYHAHAITKLTLAMAATFTGTVFLATEGKLSPMEHSNVYSNGRTLRHGVGGQHLFV